MMTMTPDGPDRHGNPQSRGHPVTLSPPKEPRVLNRREVSVPGDAVYVGRPSKWGNPFHIGLDGDRQEVILRYRKYLGSELRKQAREELRGKDLVCWCAPLPCHADVLLEVANE